MTEFERAINVSYQCSIVTLFRSCTISEIMRYFCKPEITSWWYIRYWASYIIFNDLFWNGDPKFTFMFYKHILPIFDCLQVIQFFHFGCDSPTAEEICGGFGENDPKSQTFEKQLLRGHFLTSNRIIWVIVRGNRFRVRAVRVARKDKPIKNNKKGTRPKYFTTTLGALRWNNPYQTYSVVVDLRDVINLA